MNPSTIVLYVSLSWLLLSAESFCPPQSHIQQNAQSSLRNTREDTEITQVAPQLSLSDLEDLEEARLDSLSQEQSLAARRDAIQNSRLDEMFREEDLARQARQEEINRMLVEDDAEWREERRQRMLGRFAGMGWGEVERVLREEREREKIGE